ncbi:MAG: SMP-30/gluconolactonase/LRE family protein [Abyssibacter sp.]|jgi:sugar lactone lactonase YvrE|nr:SMP-30/gluconolactonase/LRE family protein [Abyssibacter sp.]MCK5859461.1 SMP-30/gluconolactonase/LRE family protein [Abyssibacter sp.]
MKRAGTWLFLIVAIIGGYLLFYPVEIDPVKWQAPPAPPLEQDYALNSRLSTVERLAVGAGVGPEDVAISENGDVYTGYLDGRVVRVDGVSGEVTTLAETGGRPLGIALLPDGALAVADAYRGLLRISMDGRLEVLAAQANGLAFRFADDLDVARDGTIYFSDASWKYGMEHMLADFLEHDGTGRLLRYTPDGAVDELLQGLYFANGVALGPDEQYVLINETGAYRVSRLWLKGPKAGERDIFIDNLPGFPDNISYDEQSGVFWLALYGPRDAALDATADKPYLRKMIYRLPESLHPQPAHLGFVLGLDTEGRIVANLQDHDDSAYGPVTSAERAGDYLYLGSLKAASLARLPIDAALSADASTTR